jgi:two-component system response regulator AtoC
MMSDQRKVLIVALESAIRQQILSRVAAQACQTVTAETGSDALLAAVEHDVALVILDLSIAEPSGSRTIEILRKIRPRVPLVVLSDDRSLEAGRQVLQHGVFYYLLTPFDIDELDQIVRIALTSTRQRAAGVEERSREWRPVGERGGVA